MSLALQEMLEALTSMKIELIVNDNRSTMVSILERKRKYARLSLHRMFLDAANPVIIALADLVKNRSSAHAHQLIRRYINEASEKYETYTAVDPKKLKAQGHFFDLLQMYQKLNNEYFQGALNLHITWFGRVKKPKSQLSFGLYHDGYKLIKINRLLDSSQTPPYFVEYIIYHEMLHNICRPQISPSGRRIVHTQEFKKKERGFSMYTQAKEWENQFKKHLFG